MSADIKRQLLEMETINMAEQVSRGIKAELHSNETVVTRKDTDKLRGISVKVDVDVSEAITGLKALQREAKKATQSMREMAQQYDTREGSYLHEILKNIPTELLVAETLKRKDT